MSQTRVFPSAVALGAIVAASAAHADLSAEAVWQSWKDYAATSGQELVAASETRDGSALVVEGVEISSSIEEVSMSALIDRITFDEQSDGTVAITQTDSYTLRMTGATDEVVLIGISHPGMRSVASEIDGGISYDLRAPEFEVELLEFQSDDQPDELDFALRVSGLSGVYGIPNDPAGETTAMLEARAADFAFRVLDEWSDVDVHYRLAGASMNLQGNALALMDEDPAEALRNGFAVAADLGFDSMRYSLDLEEYGSRSEASGSSSDGAMRFVLNQDEFAISFSSRNGEMNISGDDMPVSEASVSTRESGFSMSMPLSAGNEPKDVSLNARMIDLAVSDEVWELADPAGELPRTPATLVLDLVGKVLLSNDLYSEEAVMGAVMMGPLALGELESLTLNQLLVRFAGAELTSEGAFTFDFDDFTTFPGSPRPTGVLEVALRGGNALLDSLVAIGAVADDEAMGARMMMALFTRPGADSDELLSTIEVREDGAVLANGQRLQ